MNEYLVDRLRLKIRELERRLEESEDRHRIGMRWVMVIEVALFLGGFALGAFLMAAA